MGGGVGGGERSRLEGRLEGTFSTEELRGVSLVGSGVNFEIIAGIKKKRNIQMSFFVQNYTISYLWTYTVTAINHHVPCQLKPITCSLVFSFSDLTGETHALNFW